MQRIVPMLAYENGAAAIDFLTRAFGFTEKTRIAVNGTITHAELELDGNVVMLSEPEPGGPGFRHYRAEDLEGHRWMFGQEVPE